MSTYNDASLIYYPSGYKASKAYSLKPTDGSGDLTFTRASSATRVNAEGLIEGVKIILPTELIVNGDFENGSTGWSLVGDFAISGGKASITSASQYSQLTSQGTNFLTSGNQYKLQVDIETLSISGVFAYRFTGGAVTPILTSQIVDGKFEANFTMPSNGNLWFQTTGSYTGLNVSIDNVSVKEVITNNVPRIDYTGGGCGKLLLEPQRTNSLLNSEDLNSWLKIDTSVTVNTTTSPNGTTNADTITASGASSLSHLIYQNLSFTSGVGYTFSVFAKANTSNFVQLVFAGNLVANAYANFDLSNGTITASAFVTAKIENYGSGWYRCSISATAISSTTNSQIVYLINSASASRGQAFVSSGESVYLWGGSFENGSYPTSYIPTTTTAVTRVADGFSVSSLFSKGIVGVNGSLFVDINTLNISGLTFTMWNTLNQRSGVIRFTSASNTFYIGLLEGSSGSTQVTLGSLPPRAKLLFRKNGTTYTLFYNGVKASTDMTAPVQTWDKMQVESDFSPNMTINSAMLFNSALSDTDAIALTTI